ncbi:hypothetical protein ACHAXA_009845 [Cyclostephanos tholiformis]|uniref:Uncharacterized protein n=1 Tax=Cyclostephanos tholiformis TaxID=382380 RepID=A0ABD3R2N7_9STRA
MVHEHNIRQKDAITHLAKKLKSKLTVFGMDIGALGSDFEQQLQLLVKTAQESRVKGQFNNAGLDPASLSSSFNSVATSNDINKE